MKRKERCKRFVQYLFEAEDTSGMMIEMEAAMSQNYSGEVFWPGVVKTMLWVTMAVLLPLLVPLIISCLKSME